MLNSYQDQTHSEPAVQESLEQAFNNTSSVQFRANLEAFSHYCPNILPQLAKYSVSKYKTFCTKLGQPNIVDITTGQAIYSIEPENEVLNEVKQFLQAAVVVNLAQDEHLLSENWPKKALPEASVVMLFGLGLGYQVELLLELNPPSVLVIYEPELDFFYSAMQVIDWLKIYQLAEKNNTLISLQLCSNGSNVTSVIADLIQYKPNLKELYLYRHITHPIMDEVLNFLATSTLTDLLKTKAKNELFTGFNDAENYVGPRAGNTLGNFDLSQAIPEEAKTRFLQNIAAFKQYYPNLVDMITDYQPKEWFFVNHQQQPNLWHKKRNVLLYQNSETYTDSIITNFLTTPYQDDLQLGKMVSWKFRHYIHYQHIAKLQSVYTQVAAMQQQQISQLNSLIIFGIGCGQHISKLNQKSAIKQLYIFEPNVDFFYASLFSFDWQLLFDTATEQEQQIYLNIGGSDNDYFADVMQQFYRNGIFAVADTKMLQAYDSPYLAHSITLLKQQLKVVLAMGDYYDHARFGISHTYANFRSNYHWLKADRGLYQQDPATELPVFIVGNGPSLDESIDFLKQHRNHVIVISCGTALKALHAFGIQPDFHAEVEQNRSTYYWITQVKDLAYLKGINVISINGLHPDTAELFANAYLAYKDGEAATYLFQHLFNDHADIASLNYAYPTVSNLAVNFALYLGFKQLYLFGVDLGYVDVDNHHSKFSAYYDQNGNASYDYKKAHGEGFTVLGNLRPTVKTKIEFDVARQVMEDTITAYGSTIEVYNCSDGAKIKGAITLQPANILLATTKTNIHTSLQSFLAKAFYQGGFYQQSQQFLTVFNIEQVRTSIEQWRILINTAVSNSTAAKLQLEQQWALFKQLSAEQGSLLFPLLHGSTTYILGILTKLQSLMADIENLEDALKQYNYVVSVWRDYLQAVVDDFYTEPLKLDVTL